MNEHVFSRVQFLKTVFSPVTRFWPPPCTHADREREGEGEGESESLSWLISQGRDEIERQQIIWINVKKSPKTHCVSVYTVSTTSSPVDFKSGTRYEENETLPQTSACGISEIRIPSIFRARFSLVWCPKNSWMLVVPAAWKLAKYDESRRWSCRLSSTNSICCYKSSRWNP